MQLKNIVSICAVALAFSLQAQSISSECDRLRFNALEFLVKNNYVAAVTNYHKLETRCNDLDNETYERYILALKEVIHEKQDNEYDKSRYTDTLIKVWERQEMAGVYDDIHDLDRAVYIMQSSTRDIEKAGALFHRGIIANGASTNESHLIYALYASYLRYDEAKDTSKFMRKKDMLSNYLLYSAIYDSIDSSHPTQETLDTYLEYVFPSSYELLPVTQEYLTSIPEDTTIAISSIIQLVELLEEKNCSNSAEYHDLINLWQTYEPNSPLLRRKKMLWATARNPTNRVDSIISLETSPEMIVELLYQKSVILYKAGKYKEAYESGMKCTGDFEKDGLFIAAKSVAATASDCGKTTFERKCNYIYAAQLAKRAGKEDIAESYRKSGPSIAECSPPVYLSCWGVTIKPCYSSQ